ncbi:MAG: ABC transporter permease [Bacteroidetes bacterium]|jgi:putative ABC transport system permease protein|nr:ABC transporter permease [Bacteroidota bacterium]
MYKLYLKLVFLNLFKRRNNVGFSLLGLSVAFAAILHICSLLSFEMGYDSHHKNSERIFRISGDIVAAENTMTHAVLGPLMGPGLKSEFPEVESFTRLIPIHNGVKLETENGKFEIEEAYTADTTVFDIFSFDFIYGSHKEALRNPNEIVINKSLSEKLYGDANPMGETLLRDDTPLTVTGVIADYPENSHHKLNVLFSMGNRWENLDGVPETRISEGYWMPTAYVFVLLQKNSKIDDITNNFQPFYEKYMSAFGEAINAQFNPVAIPLKDLHFSRNMSYDYPKGNRTYFYIFMAIGLFILIVAFFNYTNFLVSQNLIESKNIGMRKISGAGQTDVFVQFLLNSMVIIGFAIVLAVVFYRMTLPFFNEISLVRSYPLPVGTIIPFSIGLLFLLSFLSSLIPFVHQSKKSGLKLILKKNANSFNKGHLSFGRLSTIAQFSLSIALLITILFISRQLTFLTDSNMGFDKENVVMLTLNQTICSPNSVQSLKQELLKYPDIESVAFASHAPGEVLGSKHFQIDRDGKKVTKIVNSMGVDYDYILLMKMEMAEGRNFRPTPGDDNFQSIIINEAAIEFSGFTSPVAGKEISGVKIIGVMKDLSFNSLHNQTEPVVFYLDEQKEGYLNIRLRENSDISESIRDIQTTWNSLFTDEPLKIQFLDKRIQMMYEDDYAKSKLIRAFTLITLLISLMGLFNISLIKSQQKTKEIGIRKVNGARISEVLVMLNKDFVKWVAIAFVIATPIAYYAMNRWLQNFAYKIELSWWIFALAGLLAMGIAMLTVSWQSWRAARRNPVEALRDE